MGTFDTAAVLPPTLTNPNPPYRHPALPSPHMPVVLSVGEAAGTHTSACINSTLTSCSGVWASIMGAGDTAAVLQPTLTNPNPPYQHPALSSPRGNNVGTRGGPNGQPHTAALALPPTVPSASSTSCAYLEMMASVTAHLCRGKSHF